MKVCNLNALNAELLGGTWTFSMLWMLCVVTCLYFDLDLHCLFFLFLFAFHFYFFWGGVGGSVIGMHIHC